MPKIIIKKQLYVLDYKCGHEGNVMIKPIDLDYERNFSRSIRCPDCWLKDNNLKKK